MIFLVDIGNSRIKWAAYQSGAIEPQKAMSYTEEDYSEIIARLVQNWTTSDSQASRILVSSVASEEVNQEFKDAIWDRLELEPEFLATARSYQKLKNGYARPYELGIDRWLNMVGAYSLNQDSSKKASFCVIDCGTAITIDAVELNAVGSKHLGGFILPGLTLMEKSLLENTQKIKTTVKSSGFINNIDKLRKPNKEDYFFANNTKYGIIGGVYYAVVAYIENIISDLDHIFNDNYNIYMAGGDAEHIIAMLNMNYNRKLAKVELSQDLIWRGMVSMI